MLINSCFKGIVAANAIKPSVYKIEVFPKFIRSFIRRKSAD